VRFTVTNVSEEPVTVPNGKDVQGYQVSPFGFDVQVRDADGNVFRANPGAGGPALWVTPEHLSVLEPSGSLARTIPLHNRLGPGPLWGRPGRYTVRVRLVGQGLPRLPKGPPSSEAPAEETERTAPKQPERPAPWLGKTDWAELEFDLP
jgi:hypothetical protein